MLSQISHEVPDLTKDCFSDEVIDRVLIRLEALCRDAREEFQREDLTAVEKTRRSDDPIDISRRALLKRLRAQLRTTVAENAFEFGRFNAQRIGDDVHLDLTSLGGGNCLISPEFLPFFRCVVHILKVKNGRLVTATPTRSFLGTPGTRFAPLTELVASVKHGTLPEDVLRRARLVDRKRPFDLRFSNVSIPRFAKDNLVGNKNCVRMGGDPDSVYRAKGKGNGPDADEYDHYQTHTGESGESYDGAVLSKEYRRLQITENRLAAGEHIPTKRAWEFLMTKVLDGSERCDPQWLTYEGFARDMGRKPDKSSLARHEDSIEYKKENCYWKVRQENRQTQKILFPPES
ncbi:MAG: hypothetical protein HY010_13150 [Acidobacteria bacterium]|nr:hypothetical protein [Acidobacteriota bacterium]